MDDPLLVRLGDPSRDLARKARRLGERDRTRFDDLAERLADDELHREVRATVRLADFVDGRDVGVRDRRGDARLA